MTASTSVTTEQRDEDVVTPAIGQEPVRKADGLPEAAETPVMEPVEAEAKAVEPEAAPRPPERRPGPPGR